MTTALTIAALAILAAAGNPSSPAMSEQDSARLMVELPAMIASSPKTSIQTLLDTTVICETLISRPQDFTPTKEGWSVNYIGSDASVFTRDGVLIMHRLQDGDFPNSCAVLAVPSKSYARIMQAFSKKYKVPVAKGEGYENTKYPTHRFSTENHTYRMRTAEIPKSALSIVVRHKE